MTKGSGVGVLALVAALRASGALGAWVVNERGECGRAWTTASLGRGPSAMLNAPLAPVRSAVGGFRVAHDDRSPDLKSKILLPPLLTLGGGAMGLVDAAVWLGTGLADTVTGGYFEVAPEEATRLGVEPIVPAFARVPGRGSTDRCGRGAGTLAAAR